MLPYVMGRECNTYHKDTLLYAHDIEFTDIVTQNFGNTLGEQLQRKRMGLGLLQWELADKLGVSRYTIMRMENNRDVSLDIKIDIIKRLSLEPEDDYIRFLCNDFGAFIKKERIRLGMTQKELARNLGVTRKTIRYLENKYSYPLYKNYVCLIEILRK